MPEGAATRSLRPVQTETQDVGVGFIVKLLAFIGACLLLLLGLAYWIFPGQVADRRFAQPLPGFPAPTLQTSPRINMANFYRQEMARLNGVGWTDKAAGRVHIPIEQAMHDLAEHGIPGWPAGRTDVSQGDRR